jgi:hypothetical protein
MLLSACQNSNRITVKFLREVYKNSHSIEKRLSSIYYFKFLLAQCTIYLVSLRTSLNCNGDIVPW